MKTKLTKKQKIIIIITTFLLFVVGLFLILKLIHKPTATPPIEKTFTYDNNQTYEQNLENWKNQCYFKAGTTYTAKEIREKLGRSDRTVYCLDDGGVGWYNDYQFNLFSTEEDNFKLHYAYNTGWGWFLDKWYFYLPGTSRPGYNSSSDRGKSLLLGRSGSNFSIRFHIYVDTTPPPTKPNN
ncbi:hypothetical protein [Candidatus Phytoplasma solani]|uniref:Uncharacterized protein n=1 Tax=Candidatus Phytoplasma solani TaxID=69896 RepID=A0A421NXA0_9MOLU|nr:hypothetical protein [Candidatus Phytoplasma solani]RMI88626.1 hypothetical protein PSSA1_v1c4490 [Candidatus Phytoplasma solani]